MKVFVTGGAGFIGSHTCVELLSAGHEVVVVDNLCNSSRESLRRVEKITGRKVRFHKVDIRDERKLKRTSRGVPVPQKRDLRPREGSCEVSQRGKLETAPRGAFAHSGGVCEPCELYGSEIAVNDVHRPELRAGLVALRDVAEQRQVESGHVVVARSEERDSQS